MRAIHDDNRARSGPIEANWSDATVSAVTEIGKMTSELLCRLGAQMIREHFEGMRIPTDSLAAHMRETRHAGI